MLYNYIEPKAMAEFLINSGYSRDTIVNKTGEFAVRGFVVDVFPIDEDFPIVAYPIATVYLKDMDYTNKRCELCIFTSTDTEWTPESQSQAIHMLVEKAFNEYGMHKVYSYVLYTFLPDPQF